MLSVVDDGNNVIRVRQATSRLDPGEHGTSGAALGGDAVVNPVSRIATYTDRSVNLVGSGYQLLRTCGRPECLEPRLNVGDPLITGPAGFCQTASAVYDVGAGYRQLRLDAGRRPGSLEAAERDAERPRAGLCASWR